MASVQISDYEKIVAVIDSMQAMEEAMEERPGKRFMLSRVQCKEMVYEFTHVGRRIKEYKDDKSFPILTELHRITLTARKLLNSCCFEDVTSWLQAALIQDDMECFEIIRNNLNRGFQIFVEVRKLPPFQLYPRTLRERKPMFEDDQAEFKTQLLQMLDNEDILPEQVRLIATFLLRRLINEEYTILFAGSVPPPDLWFSQPGRILGRGSYAIVEAIRFFGIKMASKTFSPPVSTSSNLEKLLNVCVNEMLVMAKLKHPNVVRFISCSTRDVAIIMECVETKDCDPPFWPRTLEQYLDPKRAPIDGRAPAGVSLNLRQLLIAVDIMYQISLGMEHLHNKGVAHLDLKPSNILLTFCEDDEEFPGYVHLKIADLGMSKTEIEDGFLIRNSNPCRGTTLFRAPELYKEGQFVNMKKADIYCFALICWQILHGKEPQLLNVDFSKYHEEVFKGRRLSIDNNVCHLYLRKLIEECWHPNPDRRPSFSDCSLALLSYKALLLGSDDSQVDFKVSTEPRERWIKRFWRMVVKHPRQQRIYPPPLENPLKSLTQRIADSNIAISELRSKWRSQFQAEGSSSTMNIEVDARAPEALELSPDAEVASISGEKEILEE